VAEHPADDFNIYTLGLIRGFAFGLAGASLVIVCQFATDTRINPLYMCGVIASVPMMAMSGLMAELIYNSHRKQEGPLQGTATLFFVFALSVDLFCIGGVLFNINSAFGIAFGAGSAAGYSALLLMYQLAKKAD
jgi:hypothetical protein